MFPQRFFPWRYFAGRYWPKVGGALPSVTFLIPPVTYQYQTYSPTFAVDVVFHVPALTYEYTTYAPKVFIDQLFNIPVVTYQYVTYPPILVQRNLFNIPPVTYQYTTYPPGIIANRIGLGNADEIDQTPPRDTPQQLEKFLVGNFATLSDLLSLGTSGSFVTADNKRVVVTNGIIEQIIDLN